MTIRVLIADDQALVREGLRLLLESDPGITVVAEATDGHDAVRASEQHQPDVALLDIEMPRLDGIAAAREILARVPATSVLVLTTFETDEYLLAALEAGASGYLLKTSPSEQLFDAIRIAASGEAVLSPSVTRRVIKWVVSQAPAKHRLAERVASLTPRERDVLELVAAGATNREIAAQLFVSEATVKTHFGRILSKLGLRDRVQAVILAYESGFVRPDRSTGGHPP